MNAFEPQPGQIDLTNARWVPVVNIVVSYDGKVLLVERSQELSNYPGLWNGISGYLDDHKDLRAKVVEELREELGIEEGQVLSMIPGPILEEDDPSLSKTWIVHPVLVEGENLHITLNREARSFVWVLPEEALTYDLVPGFDRVLRTFFPNL
jgi:8-oxo-dGTP pyrophosphatase MutT (NUDIX family)